MSQWPYARLTERGSNVYVIDHVAGYLCCMWCRLMPNGNNFNSTSVERMCDHLAEHRARGDVVPDGVEDEMWADYPSGEVTPD
jgi:hypothetical protein